MKFFKLPISQQLLLIEVSFYSIWAILMIHVFSFKKYAKWIRNPSSQKNIDKKSSLLSIKRTIGRIEKHAFWKNTCFSRAIAVRMVCKRKNIKSEIYFGVIKDDREIKAHAWVISNDFFVTGFLKGLEKYQVLYIFGE